MTSAKSLFEDEELALLKKVAKQDKADLANNTDLMDETDKFDELSAAPNKTEKEISQLPQDKIYRSKEDFSFEDFLPENVSFQPISKERKEELEKENAELRTEKKEIVEEHREEHTPAENIAERIRHTLETHEFNYNGKKIPVTASLGVTTWLPKLENAEAMISPMTTERTPVQNRLA